MIRFYKCTVCGAEFSIVLTQYGQSTACYRCSGKTERMKKDVEREKNELKGKMEHGDDQLSILQQENKQTTDIPEEVQK